MMQGTAAGGAAQNGKSGGPGVQSLPETFRVLTIAAAGAVITGVVVAAAIMTPGRIGSASQSSGIAGGAEPTLAALAPAEIAEAMVTLDPATSQQVVADAKACKAPLAWLTLVKQPGGAEGAVRIRSGSYLSPAFRVTEVPQRVAIPYPAPYAIGHGVLKALGEANGLRIYLSPGWNIPALNGEASINVHWTLTNPC